MSRRASSLFLGLAVISLMLGMSFGILSGVQYLLPDFLKNTISFQAMRPLHVTSVVSWIVLAATGGVYHYLCADGLLSSVSEKRASIHGWLFVLVGATIYGCYLTGNFGGKEYLEFPPMLIVPILLGWLLFAWSYFASVRRVVGKWPVYYWMWGTGIVLMVYHLSEAYLWLNPDISAHFVQSMALQWKAGGSFVGAWNQLVGGTAIYVMHKIKGDETLGHSKQAFFFYFLGLTNLMYGWAHHIYILPTASWIRYFSYLISMTEWIIIINIIYQWRRKLPKSAVTGHLWPVKFLTAADGWIFANLILALLVSIPAINIYTHGTHFTVAHAMGTTIGINTTILMASLLYIAGNSGHAIEIRYAAFGFRLFHVSLAVFCLSLLAAGAIKSALMRLDVPFSEIHQRLGAVYLLFLLAGIGIMSGLIVFAAPLLKIFYRRHCKRED